MKLKEGAKCTLYSMLLIGKLALSSIFVGIALVFGVFHTSLGIITETLIEIIGFPDYLLNKIKNKLMESFFINRSSKNELSSRIAKDVSEDIIFNGVNYSMFDKLKGYGESLAKQLVNIFVWPIFTALWVTENLYVNKTLNDTKATYKAAFNLNREIQKQRDEVVSQPFEMPALISVMPLQDLKDSKIQQDSLRLSQIKSPPDACVLDRKEVVPDVKKSM